MISFITWVNNEDQYQNFKDSVKFPCEFIKVGQEAKSLAQAYNIGTHKATGDTLVYCHQDILILDPLFPEQVEKALEDPLTGFVGPIGNIKLSNRFWWDVGKEYSKGEVFVHDTRSGIPDKQLQNLKEGKLLSFGKYDGPARQLDALLMATKHKFVFPEELIGIHMVDLWMCRLAESQGYTNRIFSTKIKHLSEGKHVGGKLFLDNYKLYKEKFNSTLSICIIAKDEEVNIVKCINSFKDFVDEIILVDTGSKDNTKEAAKNLGAKVFDFNEVTNPECFKIDDETTDAPGPYTNEVFLANFSKPRNHAIQQATSDYIMWVDSDDIIENAQELRNLIALMDKEKYTRADLVYEYATDGQGNSICDQWRERIFNKSIKPLWSAPVHETCNSIIPPKIISYDKIKIKHKHRNTSKNIAHRNYKILINYFKEQEKLGHVDPRTLFYLGNESKGFDAEKSIGFYNRYVEVSQFDEEKAIAYCYLGAIYSGKKEYSKALKEYLMATVVMPSLPYPWFFMARVEYDKENWGKCVEYCQKGFTLKDSPTVLMWNPLDKSLYAHIMYNFALNKLGRVKEALDSCNEALKITPNNPNLLHNKKLYENFLGIIKVPLKKADPIKPGQKLDIVTWVGNAVEPWCPINQDTTGIGGSEIACVETMKRLVKKGHKVRVYGDCLNTEGIYDGVEYIHYSKMPKPIECNVFISSRQPWAIDGGVIANAKYLWVHDIHVGHHNNTQEQISKFDKVLCLSNWHKEFFLSQYPFLDKDKIIVTRNGIDLDRFKTRLPKTNKAVYASSPNRGLDVLLKLWPRVLAEIPDAELHIYYGFDSWEKFAANNPKELEIIENYKKLIKETPGVIYHGRVNQDELAKAWLTSKVWSFSSHFTETFCINAAESQAGWCVPVTTKLAALAETVKCGILLDPPNTTKEYQDKFVNEIVKLMKDSDYFESYAEKGHQIALESFGWDTLVDDWEKMFYGMIEEVANVDDNTRLKNRIRDYNARDINEHLQYIYDTTVNMNAQTIVELGVNNGSSTLAFLLATRKTNGKLYSCDIVECPNARKLVDGVDENWQFTIKDDLEYGKTWDKPIDILFIDTSHSFEQTHRELELWIPKVKPDGIIILHDTMPTPGTAFNESGVLPAVWEWLGNNPGYTLENKPNNHGLGIIRKVK